MRVMATLQRAGESNPSSTKLLKGVVAGPENSGDVADVDSC